MSDDLIGKAFGLQTLPKVKIDVPDVNDDFGFVSNIEDNLNGPD